MEIFTLMRGNLASLDAKIEFIPMLRNFFSHETSGSFVRPFKVNLGVSIADALRGKYGEVTDAEKERLIQERLESVSKSINAPFLELVGFGKIEKKQR